MIAHWIVLALFLWAGSSEALNCYNCRCPKNNLNDCDCGIQNAAPEGAHCIILEDLHSNEPFIELTTSTPGSSYGLIQDPYYILLDESISYNETGNRWFTQPKRVTFGCDWDLCNQFSLVEALPRTFQLAIEETWLTENIYGTRSIDACPSCPAEVCGSQGNPITLDSCPSETCMNPSTCSMYYLWRDLATSSACYKSECTSEYMPDEFTEENSPKYEVYIEAIVYLARNRSEFDIWQISLRCATENCTRLTIFDEVKNRISGDSSNLEAFPTTRPTTPSKKPLLCYNCSCVGPICPCSTYDASSLNNTYCTIIRESFAQLTFINYGHVDPLSNRIKITEFPFVLMKESITYSETAGRWRTQPEIVVYGCKEDLCNRPELLAYLPSSFQMRLPESWLNESILGTGEPVRDCHECPDGPICGTTDFIDGDLCPIQACNTTCLVSDLVNDIVNDTFCYYSFCGPTDVQGAPIETHRVDIEGVLYRSRPNQVDVWEVDIYCRADNCSRPEIFKELRDKLVVQTGDLSTLFNLTDSQLPKLRCYECNCVDDTPCSCNTIVEVDARTHYCFIERNYDEGTVYTYFSNDNYDPVESVYREFPFVNAKEYIDYNDSTSEWLTKTATIRYGCNRDYCNKRSLLSLVSNSLKMRLPDQWLTDNLIGADGPVSQCRNCTDGICNLGGDFDENLCPLDACNSTCYASLTFKNPTNGGQCYSAICEVGFEGEEVDKYRVELDGIIYASRLDQLEFLEIDVYCRANDCSRPGIFQEIRNEVVFDRGNLSTLFNDTSIGEPNLLRCYDCYCENDPICPCNNTLALPAGDTYCVLIRIYDGQDFWIMSEHIDRNSTRVFITEFPYMIAEESIYYNDFTTQWITQPTLIMYGCNTDLCNDHRLVPRLPISFQMRLSDEWLNKNVLGNGSTIQNCHECPDAPQCGSLDFLDSSRCPIKECNTTCLVLDIFDDPSKDEQCYQSFCAPPDNELFTIDPHRVEIEGIFYGNRPNPKVDIWEVDIYCRADDCSRPEIFQELRNELVVDTGDLSAFFNITTTTVTTTAPPIVKPLSCYECACYDVADCSCNTIGVSDAASTYCTIVRINDPDGDFLIELLHIDQNSTRVNIRKFPYILAEESIIYNETTESWYTRTNLIVYGCNTDLCNHPSLVPLLPGSFEMRLSDEWLNTNVLGNGSTIRNCHECPDAPQCGSETFLDSSRCPIKECNTTCLVSDVYNDPSLGEFCYQSYCAPPDTPQFTIDPHRVEIEGLIYGDEQEKLEIWEIDIYCQADDCSRPEIFDELRANLTVEKGNLSLIFDNSSKPVIEPELICFDCNCDNEIPCDCKTYTVRNAKDSYCTIVRQNYPSYTQVNLGHIGRNTTRVYIRDFPYLLVEESIIYQNTSMTWDTRTNLILYGCNWNYCNHPCYISFLPDSFQMRLPDAWLNENIIGSGQPVRDCHQCTNGPKCTSTGFVDGDLCPIQSCNTTCLVYESYNDPNNTGLCYDSFCAPPDNDLFTIDPYRVELEGILYLNSTDRKVELWEVDVFCRADNCSRPEIFNEIREQFTVTLGDISIFYNTTPALGPLQDPCSNAVTSTTSSTGTTTLTSTSIGTSSTATRPTSFTTSTITTPTGTNTQTASASSTTQGPGQTSTTTTRAATNTQTASASSTTQGPGQTSTTGSPAETSTTTTRAATNTQTASTSSTTQGPGQTSTTDSPAETTTSSPGAALPSLMSSTALIWCSIWINALISFYLL